MASNGVEPFQEPTDYLYDYSSLTMVKCYCCCAASFNALWNKIRVLLGCDYDNLRLLAHLDSLGLKNGKRCLLRFICMM